MPVRRAPPVTGSKPISPAFPVSRGHAGASATPSIPTHVRSSSTGSAMGTWDARRPIPVIAITTSTARLRPEGTACTPSSRSTSTSTSASTPSSTSASKSTSKSTSKSSPPLLRARTSSVPLLGDGPTSPLSIRDSVSTLSGAFFASDDTTRGGDGVGKRRETMEDWIEDSSQSHSHSHSRGGHGPRSRTASGRTPSTTKSGTSRTSDPASGLAGLDPMLRLTPEQECTIRRDSKRLAHGLMAEQLEAFMQNRSRATVASSRGMRVYEQSPLCSAITMHDFTTRKAVRRYSVQWTVRASMDEVIELLHRDDDNTMRYLDCQSVLCPETVNSRTLWRPTLPLANTTATTALEQELGRDWRGALVAARESHWLGISWWVQHMPTKLNRDRDLIVLERQDAFQTADARRGFVHVRHSVDLAELTTPLAQVQSVFVRATMTQSGLVAVESANDPGVIEISMTKEVDYAGNMMSSMHRQIILKRLFGWERLDELLWKARLLKTQFLLLPRQDRAQDLDCCDRCQYRVSMLSRRRLERCVVCERIVCGQCSQEWEFWPSMAPLAIRVGLAVQDDGVVRASVCTHCVTAHSRPSKRTQANMQQQRASLVSAAASRMERPSHEYAYVDYYDDEPEQEQEAPPPRYVQHYVSHDEGGVDGSDDHGDDAYPENEDEDSPRSNACAETAVDDFLSSLSLDDDPLGIVAPPPRRKRRTPKT